MLYRLTPRFYAQLWVRRWGSPTNAENRQQSLSDPWQETALPRPDEIELTRALYADPLVAAALAAHNVPRVPAGGPLSQRFPKPVPLTTPLVKDLYWGCGTGLSHIELLTGQATETIRSFMVRAGIPLRHAGGRTPFLRRWRSGLPAGGLAGRQTARQPVGWLYSRHFTAAGS